MNIKICGPGCKKCEQATQAVREAVAEAGLEVEIEKISDFAEMAKLGVLSTPAVIVDGQVKCVGKAPSQKEILSWIR
ncbi:MAG: thioredoxin family protein [Candidatus Electrothrix sp. GM3_4]|nr:thioredoxin family protein [Candidatus Electrothrix sp. GM3_4]